MAGTVHTVMRLLLLSLIGTGVKGVDSLIFEEKAYNMTFPCGEEFVCFHLWHFKRRQTSEYIAIVSNGEILTSESHVDESKCTLQIKDLTVEDIGRHRCRQSPGVLSPHDTPSAAPELNLMPGKSAPLQCIHFTYVEQGHCYTLLQQLIRLEWVDETGAQIENDSQHRIKQQSPCDITLTVTLQSLETTKKFRCQMTVGKTVQTSVELQVKVPALKRKGFIVEPEPKEQGHNQDTIGAAVGVVGCMVLTLLVAAFVVSQRRANNKLRDEPCNMISTNDVMNEDDVIYADIILPTGSDRVCAQECESTEYACVRYK